MRRKETSRRLFSKKRKSEPLAIFARRGRRRADSFLCAAERICAALRFAPTRREIVFRAKNFAFFAIFRLFSQKKRSIPFFSSAATYKVDEGRRRFAFETGSLVSASTEKNRFARSLDSAKLALSVALLFNVNRRRRAAESSATRKTTRKERPRNDRRTQRLRFRSKRK